MNSGYSLGSKQLDIKKIKALPNENVLSIERYDGIFFFDDPGIMFAQ